MTAKLCLMTAGLILATLGVRGAPAETWTEPKRIEERIYGHFADGNYPAVYAEMKNLITEFPQHPLTALYFHNISEMADIMGPDTVEQLIASVSGSLSKQPSNPETNAQRLIFNLACERFYRRYNREAAARVSTALQPITEWMIAGPYHRLGPADMEYPFEPERVSHFSALTATKKQVRIDPGAGTVNPGHYLFPRNGIAYLITSLEVKEAFKIRIYSRSEYRVYINGRLVLENRGRMTRQCRVLKISHAQRISLMLKVQSDPFRSMRVIITDEADRLLSPRSIGALRVTDEARCIEVPEYPYAQIKALQGMDPAWQLRLEGDYHDMLESREALDAYRGSWEASRNAAVGFMLAQSMIDLSSHDRGSAEYLAGQQRMSELAKTFPAFIPARFRGLLRLIELREQRKAYREALAILSAAPRHHPTQIAFLRLLNTLHYDKEFNDWLNRFKADFPRSSHIMDCEAEFYKKRDRARYIELCEAIIKRRYAKGYILDLVRHKIGRGEYHHAVGLAGQYVSSRVFVDEMIDALILKDDVQTARKLLFTESVKRDDPFLLYRMGLLDGKDDGDPGLFWSKMLALNPSLFDYRDYLDFLMRKKAVLPETIPEDISPDLIARVIKEDTGVHSSRVIRRSRFFTLNEDGSSRVFCDELVYVGTDAGVERWGEYRVPFSGKVRPIFFRVYTADGVVRDSYQLHSINGEMVVSILGLAAKSLIRLTYSVDNPIKDPRQTRFFSLPLTLLQDYDEPVSRTEIRVDAPTGTKLQFFFRQKYPVKRWTAQGRDIYDIDIPELPSVPKEQHDGGRRLALESFSFSSISDMNDFAAWYQGLLYGKNTLSLRDHELPVKKRSTLRETIEAVYDFVSGDIELQRNLLYYPDHPDNTLYRKRGTVEDKCLLARALLERLGVTSYVALVSRRGLPAFGSYVFHERFSDALLVVPLDAQRTLWLDFSNQYYPCGLVRAQLAQAEALVLLGGTWDLRRVDSIENRGRTCRFDIGISTEGDAAYRAEFHYYDREGSIRKLFRNQKYRSDRITAFLQKLIPTADVDSGEAINVSLVSKPLVVKASGTIPRMSLAGPQGCMIQPIILKSSVYRYISSPSRKRPLYINNEIAEEERYTYELPADYIHGIVSKHFALKNKFGSAVITIEKKSTSPLLVVDKKIHIGRGYVLPEDYGELVRFCLELKKIESMIVEISKN